LSIRLNIILRNAVSGFSHQNCLMFAMPIPKGHTSLRLSLHRLSNRHLSHWSFRGWARDGEESEPCEDFVFVTTSGGDRYIICVSMQNSSAWLSDTSMAQKGTTRQSLTSLLPISSLPNTKFS
jgi:hypothetical protein